MSGRNVKATCSAQARLCIAVGVLLFLQAACAPVSSPESPSGPPVLVSTEGLERPAVRGRGGVFVPAEKILLTGEPTEQAFAFYVTIATARPQSIELAIVEPGAQTRVALAEISRPADQPNLQPLVPDVHTQQRLRQGEALFWREGQQGFKVRLGVLAPQRLLGRLSRLHIIDARDGAGQPSQFVQVDLAQRFLYAAVLGDSITWGNGLREQDKFTTRIFEEAERAFGAVAVVQQFAQSGAQVGHPPRAQLCPSWCFGEVPTADSSISDQVGQVEHPELIDLVILNGCINDLGFPNILNPETDDAELVYYTRLFCDDFMRELLRSVRARMPNAWVVVAGYYPIVSEQSDIFNLSQYVVTQASFAGRRGFALTDEQIAAATAFRDQAAAQSELFYQESTAALRRAADAVSAEAAAAPPILVVDPGFTPEESVFAPRSLLWGTTRFARPLEQLADVLHPRIHVFPEDDTLELRFERCLEPEAIDGPFFCLYVSVGHPNREGARRYAERIDAALRESGFFDPD